MVPFPMAEEAAAPGYLLPLLLIGAFRGLIDALHAELATQGHPEARPAHGFALQAIGPEGVTTSELGRRLMVSKQAAAKTVLALEDLGYVQRDPDPADARATLVRRTPRAEDLLARSALFFARERAALVACLGPDRVAALLADLAAMQRGPTQLDVTSWLG